MKKCTKCKVIKKYEAFNKDKHRKDGLYPSCKGCKSIVNKSFYDNNLETEQQRGRDKYAENREAYNTRSKQYNADNWDKRRMWKAKRRADELNATLPGFEKELLEIYKNRPDGFHVDHIVPLRSKTICGLHVPWNLQYLTAEENLKKSNKF